MTMDVVEDAIAKVVVAAEELVGGPHSKVWNVGPRGEAAVALPEENYARLDDALRVLRNVTVQAKKAGLFDGEDFGAMPAVAEQDAPKWEDRWKGLEVL